ncbi:MAG: cytochrome P450 [Erythrobacter sp.]|nr:cytochrome P450 [Erythrobacter sp.]
MSRIDLLDLAPFEATREHELFAELRASPGLYFNPEPDGTGFWSATRHADVVAAARDHRLFVSGQGTQIRNRRAEGHGAPSVHNADPPLHGKLRAIAMPGLSREAIAARADRFGAIVNTLIAQAPRGEPFDFVERIAVRLPMLAIAEILGVPPEDAPELVDHANLMSDVRAGDTEQAAARERLFGYFRNLAEAKRRAPGDDLASRLVTARLDDAPLEQQLLDAYFMLITIAGNETTRFLVTGGLDQLVRQGAWPVLRDNPALASAAVEEMCRFVSPVTHMRRTAARDTELAGTQIKAGDKLVLWFASANRDAAVFDRADELVLDRAPNPHVGFGVGAHFCLGAHLARLESRMLLEAMARDLTDIEIIEPPERLPSNWFTGWTAMKVRWQ